MSKRKRPTRARPLPRQRELNRIAAELHRQGRRVHCSECCHRCPESGECQNPQSVKAGDYVLPGDGCLWGEKK